MSSQQDEFLRKAAVLIATLDDHAAESLLEHLGREQALRLRRTLSEIRPVDFQERAQIVQEFLQAGSTPVAGSGSTAANDADGVELDDALAARIAAEEPAPPDDDPPAEDPATSAFSFLVGVAPQVLAELLRAEHPQTIGLVLSHLAPATAAEVLQRLPDGQRGEVLGRLGQLGEIDEGIVAELEQEIQRLFQRRITMQNRPAAGLTAVRAVLQAAGVSQRQALLAELQRSDRALWLQLTAGSHSEKSSATAEPLRSTAAAADGPQDGASDGLGAAQSHPQHRKTPHGSRAATHLPGKSSPAAAIAFDDLAALDDAGLAHVFRQADPQVALLALAGASQTLVERIHQQLPRRAARELRHQIENLGPIRLSDVERAQRELAELADNLVRQGDVAAPKTCRFIGAA